MRRFVVQRGEGLAREVLVGQLGLLETDDVGLQPTQPLGHTLEASIEAVDVPGSEAHRPTLASGPEIVTAVASEADRPPNL